MNFALEPKAKEISFENFIDLVYKKDYEEIEGVLKDGKFDVNWEDFRGATVLHYAAELGDVKLLNVILSQPKVKINAKTIEIMSTPLMLAAGTGKSEAVLILLQHKADAALQNASGNTALMLAAEGGYLECVKELLMIGAEKCNIYAKDNRDNNALMLSFKFPEISRILIDLYDLDWEEGQKDYLLNLVCSEGNVYILSILLNGGKFDLNKPNDFGMTPLHCAISSKNWNVIDFLISKGATYTDYRTVKLFAEYDDTETFLSRYNFNSESLAEIFKRASFYNRINVLKYYMNKYSDFDGIDELKCRSLVDAAYGKNIEIIKYLIDDLGTEISFKLLEEASIGSISRKDFVGFKYLFDKLREAESKSEIEAQDLPYTLNDAAFEYGFPEACRLLLEHYDIEMEKEIPIVSLWQSAADGNLKMLELLADFEVDVNENDLQAGSALLLATTNNHLDCVKYLLNAGADLTITDESGFFPLLSAAYYGHTEIYFELLKADLGGINRASKNLITPILASCHSKNKSIYESLLENNAQIDVVDDRGWNVLHCAFSEPFNESFDTFLIERNVDHFSALATARDESGKTPFDLITNPKDKMAIFRLILSKEALVKHVDAPVTMTLSESYDDICSICRDELKQDDETVVLPCKHLFHKDCYESWSLTSALCPYCRKSTCVFKNKDNNRI